MWRQGDKYNVPRIVFCNKMDKTGASFEQCIKDIKERLGARPVPIQLPIGAEADFKGIIDLVRMKAVIWENEALGANYHDEDIPADLLDSAVQARADMIEACAELDDQAMEDYLNGKEMANETIKRLLRKAVLNSSLLPGSVRLGLQEQGRAAAARRGRRLSAVAARPSADQGHRRQDR